MKKKDDKIMLSSSQKELLLKTLGTALKEAPARVKDSVSNIELPRLEQDEKRAETNSGWVF